MKEIFVTQPILPPKKKVYKLIDDLYTSKWLTNKGKYHNLFVEKLKKYFMTDYVSLFANGTIALELALTVLNIKGEVITTPFTFPATIHSIVRNNLTPVFCDIKYEDYNIDENQIEKCISSKTSAILPVHVYGVPCNVEVIDKIAKKYNLKVLYDAAHAFGVKINNKSIATFGDMTMFSFHATKIFHTFEGGALTLSNKDYFEKLELLKNFGIVNEEQVACVGTNGKINEFQSGIGLLLLEIIDKKIKARKKIVNLYLNELKEIECIKLPSYEIKNIQYNYSYFPILIKENKKSINRNLIYDILKKNNIYSRKYFYPLCSNYSFYKKFKNSDKKSLPIANYVSDNILCLPIYNNLKLSEVKFICKLIKNLFK